MQNARSARTPNNNSNNNNSAMEKRPQENQTNQRSHASSLSKPAVISGDSKPQSSLRTYGSQHLESKPVPTTKLGRSMSLRQPATSRLTQPTTNHSRHQSQVVGSDVRQVSLKQPKTFKRPMSPSKSTLQQQQSTLRKPAKQPSSNNNKSLASVIGDPGTAISSNPRVASLQTELLQLHQLHFQSQQAKATSDLNVEKDLQKQHAAVVANYRNIIEKEQATQRYVNIRALDQLAEDIECNNSRYDFIEQVQMLSRVVQDVTDVVDPRGGGRYSMCVEKFEEWFHQAVSIRESRTAARKNSTSSSDGGGGGDGSEIGFGFIDPLDDSWRDALSSLSAKLQLCARELDCLDIPRDPSFSASALVRTVKGHKELLASMIEELETMMAIETEILEQERSWVTELVDRLDTGDHQKDQLHHAGHEKEPSLPIWLRV